MVRLGGGNETIEGMPHIAYSNALLFMCGISLFYAYCFFFTLFPILGIVFVLIYTGSVTWGSEALLRKPFQYMRH